MIIFKAENFGQISKNIKINTMKKYLLLVLVTFSLVGMGCEEMFEGQVLEIDLPEHEPILTPYCFVNDVDSTVSVVVQRSQGALEPRDWNNPSYLIADATVELYKNGTLWNTIPYKESILSYQIQMNEAFSLEGYGDTYELKVSAPTFESVTGTQVMPNPVEITEATYEQGALTDQFGDQLDALNVSFKDPPNEKNYYMLNVVIETDWGTNEEMPMNTLSDPSMTEGFRSLLISDEIFDGETYTARTGLYNYGGSGYEMRVILRNITKDEYFYQKSLINYDNAQNSLFPEPTLIHTNMSGGLGVFSMMASSEVIIIL